MELLKNNGNNFESLKWLLKRCKKYLFIIFLDAFIAAIISAGFIALALVSKQVLDAAVSHNGNLKLYAILLITIVVLQIVLSAINTITKTMVSGKLIIALRGHLFQDICKKKYSKISKHHSGDLLNRLTADIDIIVSGITNIIPTFFSMATKIICGILAVTYLNGWIILIVIAVCFLIPIFAKLVNKKYKFLHKKCQESEGESRSFIQECFANLIVIKSFESSKPFAKRLGELLKVNYKNKIKRTLLTTVIHLSLYSMFTIGYYCVLVWGAINIAAGVITYGTLLAFLQIIQQLRAPLQNISGIAGTYFSMIASTERLMELEDIENDKYCETDEFSILKKNFNNLHFSNVTFAYGKENVIENCDFELEKGKITALTGESGSGKSTILKLLLGLYSADEGNIILNNNIIPDYSFTGLFAYVPQGYMVLSGTIRDNITMCNENISEDELIKAAKTAEIYDVINSLPNGFDTVLSERGAGLSDGQIQRISIARALLTDAPILLLDEATSALDEQTETKVLANIKAIENKTVLFVTHRNTSLKICDKIVHIENKKASLIKQ